MEATTISSKFQVVIPKKMRQLYNLKPGQKLVFIPYKNSLRVVIVHDPFLWRVVVVEYPYLSSVI